MNREKNVIFPNGLIENGTIETTFFPSNSEDIGIAAISYIEYEKNILRLYQLLYFENKRSYQPIKELVSFSFDNRRDLTGFLMRIPEINGLEMLMLISESLPNDISYLN